jgi:6-phosphogluconate dehydrogenase
VQLGMIGLGRMGSNMVRRLLRGGHQCVVFNRTPQSVAELVKERAIGTASLAEFARNLTRPRAVWLMVPVGAVDQAIADLLPHIERGDIVIDGGNSYYIDDIRRAKELAPRGINYIDVGTSGGVWGLERGYCMMVGGDPAAVARIDPILATLAPGVGQIPRTRRPAGSDPHAEQGYIHAGPVGAGHFVKMIHNGIEYGLMQAYAEGFDILKNKASEALPKEERFDLNLPDIAEVWRRGSVISSWLLDLTAQALAGDPKLAEYTGAVADSGEGRWTIEAALEEAVPADVMAAALFARFRSREDHTFGEKLLSAMRFGFGGHVEDAAER